MCPGSIVKCSQSVHSIALEEKEFCKAEIHRENYIILKKRIQSYEKQVKTVKKSIDK